MDASGLGGPARAHARAALRGRRLGRRQKTIARKTARSRAGSMRPVAGSVMAARYIRACDAANASTRRFRKPGWREAGGSRAESTKEAAMAMTRSLVLQI